LRGDAELGDRARQLRGNIVTKKGHAARLRPEVTRRYIEERRLAGPVGSDDGEILALMDVKIDSVGCDDPAEADLDAFGREQDAH
jgi:hypothetical protein